MGAIDRAFDLDNRAEAATAGDGRKEAGSDVPVESRTRGECYADLRQAAESGWDRGLKFDAPRGELARFKPERAGLCEVSVEEARRYIEQHRGERPWLKAAEGALPETWRIFAAADLAGAHGHVRHDGWVTEEASMNRAACLQDPAELDPARRLRGIDGLVRGGRHHRCADLATRVTDPDAYATATARGTEHPAVRAALDGPHDPRRHPWAVEVPIADLLGGDGHLFCTGWMLDPGAGSTDEAWRSRQEWRAAMYKGLEPGVPRPAVRPVPTFEGGTMAFIIGSSKNHDRYQILTMCPDPRADVIHPPAQRDSQRETR